MLVTPQAHFPITNPNLRLILRLQFQFVLENWSFLCLPPHFPTTNSICAWEQLRRFAPTQFPATISFCSRQLGPPTLRMLSRLTLRSQARYAYKPCYHASLSRDPTLHIIHASIAKRSRSFLASLFACYRVSCSAISLKPWAPSLRFTIQNKHSVAALPRYFCFVLFATLFSIPRASSFGPLSLRSNIKMYSASA